MAVVAIGALVVDTFPTLLVVPVLFHVLESGRMRVVGCVTKGCDGRGKSLFFLFRVPEQATGVRELKFI